MDNMLDGISPRVSAGRGRGWAGRKKKRRERRWKNSRGRQKKEEVSSSACVYLACRDLLSLKDVLHGPKQR